MFTNIKTIDNLYFSSCDGCTDSCCSAPKASIAPLILDDFEEVYKNFAIQFAYINDEFKAQMVMNNGNTPCSYLKNGKCIIYDDRPPVCHMYPISPYYEEFFIDTSCHAVGNEGDWICGKGEYSKNFYHKRVENFLEKLDMTKRFLNMIEDDIVPSILVQGIQLYSYNGNFQNEYIDMYKESIKHLDTIK